jgi:hypothetical protein
VEVADVERQRRVDREVVDEHVVRGAPVFGLGREAADVHVE